MSDEDNKLTSEDQPQGTIKDKVENQVEDPTGDENDMTPDDKNPGDNDPEQLATDQTTKKKCRGRSFALVFLILIGGLMAGGVYLWKELQQTRSDLAELGNNRQAQEQAQAGLTSRNTAVMAAMEDAIKQLGQKQSEQSQALASLYRDMQGDNEDWAIAEVDYLLIIAMHRLLLEEDVISALAAMEAADLRLKNLGDPGLLPVRQQLVSDMNQLRAVNNADIAGMAIYLAELVELAADLPLNSEVITKATHSSDEDQIDEGLAAEPFWKKIPRLLWQEIKSLVVIKRTGEAKQALLLPDEEYFLTQNLRLELESARLSVLRADTGNLRASIVLIQAWLSQYFDTNNSAVINVMDTLDQMQQIELKPALPDISSSVETLRAYLREDANSETSEAVSVEEIQKETQEEPSIESGAQ
jgi:uroporphyrin-3 C-methyltransferase